MGEHKCWVGHRNVDHHIHRLNRSLQLLKQKVLDLEYLPLTRDLCHNSKEDPLEKDIQSQPQRTHPRGLRHIEDS